jgi:hypothetical protein
MSVTRIAEWRNRFPGRIAESAFPVSAMERARTARDLADAGLDVHVDMMASGEGLPVGLGVTEDVASPCLTAGTQSMVVGRALLSPRSAERKAI